MLIVLQHVDMVIRYVGVFLIKHLYLNGVCEKCAPHKRYLKEIVYATLHLIVNKIFFWGGEGESMCSNKELTHMRAYDKFNNQIKGGPIFVGVSS